MHMTARFRTLKTIGMYFNMQDFTLRTAQYQHSMWLTVELQ